jgi:aspartate kinase
MTTVVKFGGTSVSDAARREACAGIVRGLERPVVVVSALDGVTELLDELATAAAAQNRPAVEKLLATIRDRHEEPIDELERIAGGILALGELTPRSRDLILSFGERFSAPMLARAIGPQAVALTGRDAGLVTDDTFGEARPLMELSKFQIGQALSPLLDRGRVPVVTGFIAATQSGAVTTLGRGGSDYSATLIGAALEAEEVVISSDVDGLMTADPRIVPDARLLETVGYAEAIEMVQFGAKAMHPRAIEPAAEHRVPVRIRNTFNPKSAGTLVTGAAAGPRSVARSINLVRNVAQVNVTGAAMVGRPGTAARVFSALAEAGVNILMISQSVSESSISLAVGTRHLERAQAALEGALIRPGIARGVAVTPDACVTAIVGSGMAGTPGVAARAFGAVARRGVNVMAIAQGSSELSISFVVRADQGPEAVRALHEEFQPS